MLRIEYFDKNRFISVSDPADVTGFLRYMLEAGRAC